MDVTYARLHAARKYFGNNPRRGFFASISSFSLEKQVASITEQISAVAASTDIGALMYDIRRGGTSSHLFQIYSSHDYHPLGNCPIKHVSDWSFNRLLEKYEERQTDAALELFNLFRVRNGLQIATFIWERQFFRSLRSPRSFVLRSLDDHNESITCEWDYPGFERVQRWLKLKGPTSHLCPSETRPWMFIFIVPEGKATSLKQQSFGKIGTRRSNNMSWGCHKRIYGSAETSPLTCLS